MQEFRKEGRPGIGGFSVSFDPDHSAAAEPALWRPEAARAVVALDRAPPGLAGVSAARFPCVPIVDHLDDAGRHMIFEAGGMRHRFSLRHRDASGPLVILLPMTSNETALAAADAARQWFIGAPIGAAGAVLRPTDFQRHRLETMLRALDLSLAGASLRAIGAGLLYPRLAGIDAAAWKASSERRRAQRLLAEAHAMMRRGYRKLLAGSPSYGGGGDNSSL